MLSETSVGAQLPVYKRGTTKLVIDSLSEIFRSFRKTHSRAHAGLSTVDLLAGESIDITFYGINTTKNCLFIIQAVDVAQGKHQLQILTKANETGVEIKMVQAMVNHAICGTLS